MTRFDHVKEILDNAVNGQNIHAHGPFWRGNTRDQFVNKTVFGEQLLIVGNGAGSNLVRALKGEPPFGSDTGNDNADYPRMPVGFPSVPQDQIAFIETWIDEGCLEDPWPPAAPVALAAAGNAAPPPSPGDHDITYWREFDNQTLYHPTPPVAAAINDVMPRMGVWRRFAKGLATEAQWDAAISLLRSQLETLSTLQTNIVQSFYGTPIQTNDLFQSYQGFGADTLPDDPLRPDDPRHRMNGETMWFVWFAVADACLRLNIDAAFWEVESRAMLIGAANDGLFRGRFAVNGFAATPAGQGQIISYFGQIAASSLPSEMAQRYRDSGL